jgi:competence protein ComFC
LHRTAYNLYSLFWQTIDWIYPPECGGCSKPGNRWCVTCQDNVIKIPEPVCVKCGTPLMVQDSKICLSCLTNPPPYNALRSYGYYDGLLREALHKLKFDFDIGLAEVLSKYLIKIFNNFQWSVDMITAVPLSKTRMNVRGYNQSALLALPIALYTGIPFVPKAISRIRDTKSQVGLTALERQQNVKSAFISNPGIVKYKRILIVDDIATTGATISSCAHALGEAGAKEIYGLTVAKTILTNSQQSIG